MLLANSNRGIFYSPTFALPNIQAARQTSSQAL